MEDNNVLRIVSKIIVPFIQIFGLYIMLFGHIGPGGGFAGGTVLGTSFILIRINSPKEYTNKLLNYNRLFKIFSAAMIFYGLLKGYSFINGGSHLSLPNPPLGIPGNILSGGYILPLNILVGIVVSITMYFLFSLFYEGEI